ncbi:uncharacterized protein G2W53_032810 [Senna tora]|uniref:Uncharacterized protein n=1 Tax=Senna tora TaxID=362788 RepID=A0A834WC72_9FABA|nr:uncharacterized protein G2W53_032810 [Senna tora]
MGSEIAEPTYPKVTCVGKIKPRHTQYATGFLIYKDSRKESRCI